MKTSKLHHLFALVSVALTLCSCEVPFKTPFNEAEFKWTRGKGTGAVDGQLYIEMKDKSVNFGRKAYVVLFPVNSYTTEYITRRYQNGEHMALGDPRMAKYLSDEYADSEGRFSMRGLAPGEYYVGAMVDWVDEFWDTDADGNSYKSRSDHSQFIWSPTTIRNGYTIHVSSWNQGSDVNWNGLFH
jgi:hypothetical protein